MESTRTRIRKLKELDKAFIKLMNRHINIIEEEYMDAAFEKVCMVLEDALETEKQILIDNKIK